MTICIQAANLLVNRAPLRSPPQSGCCIVLRSLPISSCLLLHPPRLIFPLSATPSTDIRSTFDMILLHFLNRARKKRGNGKVMRVR